MTTPRLNRQKKKLILLGCEGKSELAYAALLNQFIHEADLSVQIRPLRLESSGDPLSRVQLLLSKTRTDRKQYPWMGILLDSDQVQGGHSASRARDARHLAEKHDINLIWQNPCHEGLLLRHMPGQDKIQPVNCIDAQRKLVAIWDKYQKPMNAKQLARRIGLEDVQRAARAEPDLRKLLKATGLPLSTR